MFFPDFDFEKSLLPAGCRYLVGVDEVGRGPWAGPISVGACLLDLNNTDPSVFSNLRVTDSKLISPARRHSLSCHLKEQLNYTVVSASAAAIDLDGLAFTLKKLIYEAVAHFAKVDYVLIDGNYHFDSAPFNYLSLVKGDSRCYSIALASIMAKVDRDAEMDRLALVYPGYGFEKHKGYGTKFHQQALAQFGPCPIHRRSFKPINQFL